MSAARLPRYLMLAALPILLVSALPCSGAGVATPISPVGTPISGAPAVPLPAGGTVTQIDGQIQTNLVLLSTGATIPLSVQSSPHAKCESQSATLNSSGHQEFTNSFQSLQATFPQTPIGPIVIVKNPNLPINGLHVASSSQAVFPVHSKIWLYLQVSAAGMTLVNRDPIILEADINAWPQVGAVYQATTGNIDFFATDVDGNPTGAAVAQLFGTHVTVTAGQTLTAVQDQPGTLTGN